MDAGALERSKTHWFQRVSSDAISCEYRCYRKGKLRTIFKVMTLQSSNQQLAIDATHNYN